MAQHPSRRTFLRSASLAAAALPLADKTLAAQPAAQPAAPPTATPQPFQVFTAETLSADTAALHAKPGNNNLFDNTALPFTVVLTVEEKKAAKEFEYHEGRDHILQILEGTTVYEIGGTPQSPHSSKPSEWNAPTSDGATKLTLSKGDMLIIPRNTPHKRTTDTSVTFYLISTTGNTPT